MRLFLTPDERRALADILPLLQLSVGSFILSVIWGATGLGAAVALGSTSAWLIARASQMPPVLFLQVAVTSVRLFGISRAVFRYIERLSSHRVALNGIAKLRTNVYIAMSKRSTATIAGLKRGQILQRTGQDVDAVGDVVVKSFLPIAEAAVVCTGSIIGIMCLDWRAGLVLAACMLVSAIVGPALTIRSARRAESATQKARGQLLINATTLVDSASELAVSGRSHAVISAMHQAEQELQQAQDKAAKPAAIASAIDTVMMLIAVIGGLYFGNLAVHAGTLSPVALAVVAITPLSAFEATSTLGPASVQLVISAGAAQRVLSLLNAPADTANEKLAAGTHYQVEAVNADLAWPQGPTIATGIDLSIKPGTKLAIVGKSGVGKSTLLYTLAGMLPPASGSVNATPIPGSKDAKALALSQLRRDQAAQVISLTAEDAYVFAASVFENLRVANSELTQQQARDALGHAGLGDWVDSLADGLDTLLGSEGTTISGGERRRLLIARALCTPAPLLAIDEPAEHLDPATADKLITDLFALADQPERGVIVVTHRISPLAAADRVLVLEKDGNLTHVAASGTHAQLLQTDQNYRWALAQEQDEATDNDYDENAS